MVNRLTGACHHRRRGQARERPERRQDVCPFPRRLAGHDRDPCRVCGFRARLPAPPQCGRTCARRSRSCNSRDRRRDRIVRGSFCRPRGLGGIEPAGSHRDRDHGSRLGRGAVPRREIRIPPVAQKTGRSARLVFAARLNSRCRGAPNTGTSRLPVSKRSIVSRPGDPALHFLDFQENAQSR